MRQILIKGQNSSKIPVFCTFWRNPFADFDDSLEPSSGFFLPFLCISRRFDQNWGRLLQTLPHTHTITQIIVRYTSKSWSYTKYIGPSSWNIKEYSMILSTSFYDMNPWSYFRRESQNRFVPWFTSHQPCEIKVDSHRKPIGLFLRTLVEFTSINNCPFWWYISGIFV